MSMISSKTTTKAWSNTPQDLSTKSDRTQTLSSTDREKVFDGQTAADMGELLNKVADPNWVDPAKTRRAGNNQLDKDAFLKLMLTQMKYQDPTNPMQSHEMASQLAQFTSLEQLNNINTNLEGMKTQQAPQTNFQALNFIGKVASGDSSKITRTVGDTKHEINFTIMSDSNETVVNVKDSEGNLVKKLALGKLKKGANSISWNGLNEDGFAARPGEYKISIDAKSASGAKLHAKTDFDGRITGVNFTTEGPVLLVGNQTIKLKDVKKIIDATTEVSTPPPAQSPTSMNSGDENVPAAEEPKVTNTLNQIAMNRDAWDKLNKEVGGN